MNLGSNRWYTLNLEPKILTLIVMVKNNYLYYIILHVVRHQSTCGCEISDLTTVQLHERLQDAVSWLEQSNGPCDVK